MSRRVVVTGLGIVSCLGNDQQQVLNSLQTQTSGIQFIPEYKEMGLRCHIAGRPDIDLEQHIDRKLKRFMSDSSAYAYIAMQQAIDDAQLNSEQVSNVRTGIIAGSGGAGSSEIIESVDVMREKGVKRMGPYRVTRTMASTVSANLATAFSIKGTNYSLSSACATSAHAIGHAMELIQWGKQDIVFAGGGEEEHWSQTMQFDAMGALSTRFNDQPTKASRPYDQTRDGFVIAGGGAILVLEEYQHAKQRGAKIYAEVVGYGATSDGLDMVAPSGEGATRCMQMAIDQAEQITEHSIDIDYVNSHGTSTPAGDVTELNAISQAFKNRKSTFVSSTKSLSGHSLGAAGAHEAIYSLLMLNHDFLAGSCNIEQLDEKAQTIEEQNNVKVLQNNIAQKSNAVMSNSFGFGGTNACLIFRRLDV